MASVGGGAADESRLVAGPVFRLRIPTLTGGAAMPQGAILVGLSRCP
jgi:hypothetical protein